MIINKMITHTTKNKNEGALCVAEGKTSEVPFEIKRVYYTYGVEKNITRGHHAHKSLEQILICITGSIEVTLDYGNGNIESKTLSSPEDGLYVGPKTWRTMKWVESDSVLLVLASEHYNADDYIRNYDEFISWVNRESEI